MRNVIAFLLFALAGLPAYGQETPASALAGAVNSMSIVSEVRPHGVPDSYGWPVQPLIQAGNTPPAGSGANYVTPWLQIYETAEGTPSVNTRVQYRRLCGQIYYPNHNSWGGTSANASKLGAMYHEDYTNDQDKVAADYRDEADGVSVKFTPGAGRVFHTWAPYTQVYPDDIGFVYVTFQARLIKDDPNGTDDRSTARFVASAGADWYTQYAYAGGLAIGRFKRVDSDWRTYVVTTATQAQLTAHPPSC